jgi:hypothetical protein
MVRNCIAIIALMYFSLFASAEIVWQPGPPINDPKISKPKNNEEFGLSTALILEYNDPIDVDIWIKEDCDGYEQGEAPDKSVKASWDDGGAGGKFRTLRVESLTM